MNLSRSFFLFPCALFALAGCGPDATEPANPNDVTGTIVDLFVTDTGEVEEARDATTASVAAIVQGEDGQFETINGTIAADGSFTIPGVPQGNYFLKLTKGDLEPMWVVSSERQLDLGDVYAGRPDVARLKGETTLDMQLAGLAAWQDTDILDLFSAGAGIYCLLPGAMTGETTVNAPVNLLEDCHDASGAMAPPAIDATKGDRTFVTQSATYGDPAGGESYASVRKAFEAEALTVTDGKAATLSGTFVDVPQKNIKIAWDQAGFAALAAEVHPQATQFAASIDLGAEPGGDRATASISPTLLNYRTSNPATALTDFQYGNPYPSAWHEYYSVSMTYSIMLTAPGSMTPRRATALVFQGSTGVPAMGMKVAPIVSPPQDIKVNGKDATADLTGVGTNPTVSWSAPAKGTAASYTVTVRKFDPAGGLPPQIIGSIRTRETSLTLPPGMLESGSSYFLRVRAVNVAPDAKSPFLSTADASALADALTSIISP